MQKNDKGAGMKYIYHIESIKYGKTNNIKVIGWFVSNCDIEVKFITELGNTEVKNSCTFFKRKDVANLYFDISDNINVGFILEVQNSIRNNLSKLDIYAELAGKRYLICKNGRESFRGVCKRIENRAERKLKVMKPVNLRRLGVYYSNYGLKGMREKYSDMSLSEYDKWFKRNQTKEGELNIQRDKMFSYSPKFSIVVKGNDNHKKYFREMLEAVKRQTYGNYELHIIDEFNIKELKKKLSGEYICFLDRGDVIESDALYEIVNALQEKKYDVLYTDEDSFDETGTMYEAPCLKPDFSPDLLCSYNYISHLFVTKKKIFDKLTNYKSEYEWAEYYNMILECIDNSETIRHIPKVLYHARNSKTKNRKNLKSGSKEREEGRRVIQAHIERLGYKADVKYTDMPGIYRSVFKHSDKPLVSVIIANMDHVSELDNCIKSIIDKSTYRNFEIIIVENNSSNACAFEYYENIQRQYSNIRVLKREGMFNYSAVNNFGVKNAKGEYLLLLNNDTEMISKDAIEDMLCICMRSDVGIVGAKLYYQDDTIQHAGIVTGFNGYAAHIFNGFSKNAAGYMMRAKVTGNYSAVTAACLMTKKKLYEEVGGLDEVFGVACNDVDFCLRLRTKGYLVVYDAFAEWYHYESKSRGYEDTPEKRERFNREVNQFRERWSGLIDAGDEYYNINFPLTNLPFILD